MAEANPNQKPKFFWQGVLILLPVAVLTVMGLFSLRQDRLLAEQEAKELGASIARQLTHAIDDETVRQLTAYRRVNFELNLVRKADLGLTPQWADATGATLDIQAWQQANPGIDLSNMPVSDWFVDPREEASYPVIYPVAPSPPDWARELSPEQRRLWAREEMAENVSNNVELAQAAIDDFIATKPPDGAETNAAFHRLLLKTRGLASAEAVAELAESRLSRSGHLTEAGLPIGQLVCYRALRLVPDRAGVPDKLLHSIIGAIASRPSILSPPLITEAERAAASEPADSENGVARLSAWWASEERAREVVRDFYEQHPPGTWTDALLWVTSQGGGFLFVLDAVRTEEEHSAAGTRAVSSPGYLLYMFPRAVVDKALAGAVAKADISVPPYAVVGLEIAGRELLLQPDNSFVTARASSLPILGEASGNLAALPLNGNVHPFQAQVFLADRDALYSRQRQRTLLFGALILASTLAATAGLLAARHAFYRQLQLNEMKSNFVSSVSHELRAPIASVRLMAENLERGKIPDAPRQHEYFRFIVQECRRLSSLIENVLDFSRIEQGRKQYEFEPTDVVALAQTTVKLMEPSATEKGVNLEISNKLEPASVVELNVDGRAIQQALVNLIDNAIKHSPRGETVTVGVEIKGGLGATIVQDANRVLLNPLSSASVEERAGVRRLPSQSAPHSSPLPGSRGEGAEPTRSGIRPLLCLSVSDHGPGIPAAEHERIFERFYRLGSELRRETQGVGIGLSVVQHIVAGHSGRIVVKSEPGKGSRFTIELPMRSQNE